MPLVWNAITNNLDEAATGTSNGDVNGPANSLVNAFAYFSDNTGKNIDDSIFTFDNGDTANFWGGFLKQGPTLLKRKAISTDYTILSTDALVAVTGVSAPFTISLPTIPITNQLYYIKDESGDVSALNTLTIDGNGNDIDGLGAVITSTSYYAAALYWDGAEWHFLFQTSSGGGGSTFTWNNVAGTSATLASANGYVSSNAALTTLQLPASSAFGDMIKIFGYGAGGFSISQAASQQILFGNQQTTAGLGGGLTSADLNVALELHCVVPNLVWWVQNAQGSLNVT